MLAALLAGCGPAPSGPESLVVRPAGEPSLTALAGAKQPDELDVMTFNIQDAVISGAEDYLPSGRREAVAQVLADERPDVVGTQELLVWQAEALREDLARAGLRYERYGRARVSDDEASGADFNETVSVLWNPDVLTDLDRGDVWICAEGTEPVQGCIDSGPGWRAGDPRMLTWVRFRHRATGTELVVVNTHLDATSAQAREHGAQVVRDTAQTLFPGTPVVVTADFNGGPGEPPDRVLLDAGFVDTWPAAARTGRAWTTFNRMSDPMPGPRIDRVYVRPALPVVAAALNTWRSEDGVLPSDHWPVLSRVRLP